MEVRAAENPIVNIPRCIVHCTYVGIQTNCSFCVDIRTPYTILSSSNSFHWQSLCGGLFVYLVVGMQWQKPILQSVNCLVDFDWVLGVSTKWEFCEVWLVHLLRLHVVFCLAYVITDVYCVRQ